MAQTVFFSWQSDSPPKIGREFLEKILREVCKDIAGDTTLDEAQRQEIVLDSDTKNVPGQPPVFQTILNKIDVAAVFVADLTFVGDRRNGSGPIPNPNVLIEHGYALKTLKHERIIHIINTVYGKPSRENLPFDLVHLLYPTTYHLEEGASQSSINAERERLYPILNKSVRSCLGLGSKATSKTVAITQIFSEHAPKNGPARFRESGQELGIKDSDWFNDGKSQKVFLPEGAAMWLRVIPAGNPGVRLRSADLKKIIRGERGQFTTLISRSGGYDYVRAEDGMGLYYASGKEIDEQKQSVQVPAVAFIFETGEIWSIDTAWLQYSENIIPFIEEHYKSSLTIYANLLRNIEMEGPYKWIAGISGVKGRKIAMPPPPPGKTYFENVGKECVTDTIQAQGQYDIGQEPGKVLQPFFEEIFDRCGMERPTHLK